MAETRRIITQTAERMFGEYGLESVSMRKIAEAAGQGNNNAVQYHFKTKRGLIEAILASRAETVNQRRQERLLDAAEQGQLGDVRTLLEAIFLPPAEITDADGRHTYARFIIQFLLHYGRWKDIRLARPEDWLEVPLGFGDSGQHTLLGRLRAILPAMPEDVLKRRLTRGTYLLFSEVVAWENDPTPIRQKLSKAEIMDDVMATIVDGFAANYAKAPPTRARRA